MEFINFCLKVVIGAFILFHLSKSTYETIGSQSKWNWVFFVGFLSLTNMLAHRFLFDSSINPPFFTAILFANSLIGLTPKESPTVFIWYKRGGYAILFGTILGWLFYSEIIALT